MAKRIVISERLQAWAVIAVLLGALLLLFPGLMLAGDGTWATNGNAYKIPHYPGEIKYFECTVDSVDTLTSNYFSLGKWDAVYWGTPQDTVPKGYIVAGDTSYYADQQRSPFKLQYQASSTLGSPKITGYVQGSFDLTNWVNVDTLFTDLTSESLTRADLDLNNEKYPWYRVVIYGVALNRSDTTFIMRWYCYHND